jgi:hypothetical protein
LAAATALAGVVFAVPAGAQGLSFPLPGQEVPPSSVQQTEPYRPAVSPFETESLADQWNPRTNPPQGRVTTGACKDAATKLAEQSPSPPTAVTCY